MIAQVSASSRRQLSFPIRGGVLVGICGPSGSGKDSVLNYARERMEGMTDVTFVRRVVTRNSDLGSEDHDTLDDAAFAAAASRGAFALTWEAHDLSYALPATVDLAIAAGKVALANVSRAALPRLRQRYARVAPVLVTAPPELLARRLVMRGREQDAEIATRLSRIEDYASGLNPLLVIDNAGPLHIAGERLVQFILECRSA